MVMPGDNITMEVTLLAPIAMDKGLKFAIREGGRTVGAGVVAEIIEQAFETRSISLVTFFRSVAQLVEHRSPKPGAAGSSPATPANILNKSNKI